METIGSFDAKTHFSALLDRVERGESVTITRRGKAVAQLRPILEDAVVAKAAAFARLAQFRADFARPMTDEEVIALVREGRKY